MSDTIGIFKQYEASNGDVYSIRNANIKVDSVEWDDSLEDENYAITKNGVVATNGNDVLYFHHFNTGKGGAEPTYRALIEQETGELPDYSKIEDW